MKHACQHAGCRHAGSTLVVYWGQPWWLCSEHADLIPEDYEIDPLPERES